MMHSLELPLMIDGLPGALLLLLMPARVGTDGQGRFRHEKVVSAVPVSVRKEV